MYNLFNLISPLLVKVRYRNKKDPFRLFNTIVKGYPNNQINFGNDVILFTPVRVSPMSNLFEALLAKFFESKGYYVKMLMCNQTVHYCDNIQKTSFGKITCALCLKEQKRLCKNFNLEMINANDYISKKEKKEILNIIFKRSFDNKSDYIYDGIDLYDSIESAVMRYTLKSDIRQETELIKKYAYTAFLFSRVTGKIILENRIKEVITSHGTYSTWGSIIETCKKNKIPFVVWGRGYVGQGNIVFGTNKNYWQELIEEDVSSFKNVLLTDNKKASVLSYFLEKQKPVNDVDLVNYYRDIKYDNSQTDDIYKKIKNYNIKFGFVTNIPWDGGAFHKSRGFPLIRLFVKTVIDWFVKNQNCLLIIRSHPAEVAGKMFKETETFEDLLKREYQILPDNVILIKPDSKITSYEVASMSDAVIVYGSTMALELAIQRKIIIQGGLNNVSFKNIVFDANNEEALFYYLDLVRDNNLTITDEMYNNAIKYGYYFIFLRHIIEKCIKSKNLEFIGYQFLNYEEFLSNEMLNLIYNKILSGERIINNEVCCD